MVHNQEQYGAFSPIQRPITRSRPATRAPIFRSATLRETCSSSMSGRGTSRAIWSLAPLYNMWKIALESHEGIFGGSVWLAEPTLEAFRVVVTQDF